VFGVNIKKKAFQTGQWHVMAFRSDKTLYTP